MSPRELHDIILRVADTETEMAVGSTRKKVSVFEMNVWRSASGAPSSRLAAKDFIDLAKSSAYYVERDEARSETDTRRHPDDPR